jgi:hypothetical protein
MYGGHSNREKSWKEQGGTRWPTVCLIMYNINENIYYSQLSSVAILLQPEPTCFTSYNTRKGLCSLSLCAIVLRSPPPSHVSTSNGQQSSQLFCIHYVSEFRQLIVSRTCFQVDDRIFPAISNCRSQWPRGLGLRPSSLTHCDCRFKFHIVLVFLCCVVLCRQRPCNGLVTRPSSPTKCRNGLRNLTYVRGHGTSRTVEQRSKLVYRSHSVVKTYAESKHLTTKITKYNYSNRMLRAMI